MGFINDLTDDEKDLLWRYYVSYYIGLKQKIQSVFLDMYANRQGFFNDCIGNNASQNLNRVKALFTNYQEQKSKIHDWITDDPGVTLYTKNKQYLKEKEKRFLPYDETYESEQSEEYNYQQFTENAQAYY